MREVNQNVKKGEEGSKVLLRGKLKSFYDLCMITPKIPSRVIHGVASAADSDNMIELRRTSLSNVYVHPVTCSTLPESAFEYFTESDVSEPAEGFLQEAPGLTINSTNTEAPMAQEAHYEGLSGIVKATENLGDALRNLCAHSEPAEGVINDDPSHTMEDVIKVPPECSEGTLSDNTIKPLVMSNSTFSKATQLKHRTHYVKLTLRDPNLSFRYFFESEDNKHQVGFWWLKDHKNKSSIKINKDFIRKHYEDIVEMHEIIGRHLHKKGYMKIIKNLRTNELVEIKDA